MPATPPTGKGSAEAVLSEMKAAWEQSQSQLRELRRSVESMSELARLQSETTTFTRERDKAYRELGEAVFRAHKEGILKLPLTFGVSLLKRVEEAERRAALTASSITDLLRASERPPLPPPTAPRPSKAVTGGVGGPPKKRG